MTVEETGEVKPEAASVSAQPLPMAPVSTAPSRPPTATDGAPATAAVTGVRRRGLFYGWWVVFGGTVLMTLMGTFSYYGMGVFFNSIREDLGWNAAALGAALSLARIQGGVLAPMFGMLIDRYGSQRLIFIGVLMSGAGFVLLSRTHSIIYFYIVFILLVQGGISAGMGNAPTAAVTNWFSRRRSTALGVMNLGASLGGILAKPLAEIITAFGWRTALVVSGCTIWVVGLPLGFLIRHKPESYGYLPDGVQPDPLGVRPDGQATDAVGPHAATLSDASATAFSPKEAVRTGAFWSIALMFSARHFVTGSVALFLIPLLQERGMSLSDAATVLSLMAFIGMPGRVGFAWLGDHMDKRVVIGICFVFQSIGLILFTVIGGTLGIIFFLVLYSPTYSGVLPLIPAIQADYFGRAWFATITGMMAPVATVATVCGPIVVTSLRDFTGSYEPAFTVLAVVNVLALVFVAITRAPRSGAFARAA